MNACEIGHIGRCTTRSVSRECLWLVFTKTVNHLCCSNCTENRLDIKFDTLAPTLMISAWELHYKRSRCWDSSFSLLNPPRPTCIQSHNNVIRKALSLHVQVEDSVSINYYHHRVSPNLESDPEIITSISLCLHTLLT